MICVGPIRIVGRACSRGCGRPLWADGLCRPCWGLYPALRDPSTSWTCHVCGEERDDSVVSVVSHDVSALSGLPPTTHFENVRYCNDRAECAAAAFAHPDPPAPLFPSARRRRGD